MKKIIFYLLGFLFMLSACKSPIQAPENKDGSAVIQEYAILTRVFDKNNNSPIADAQVVVLLDQNQIGSFTSDSSGIVKLSVLVQADEFNLDKIKIKTTKPTYNELVISWIDLRNDSISIALTR